LAAQEAATFAQTISDGLRQVQHKRFATLSPSLDGALRELEVLFRSYARYSAIESWTSRHAELARKLGSSILRDALSEQAVRRIDGFLQVANQPHALRASRNTEFERTEAARFSEFFDGVEKKPLTERQRLACIRDEDHNLVLAGGA